MSTQTHNKTPGVMETKALKAKISEAYARQSREADEEQRILQNLPLVRHIASKVASYVTNEADKEDLISAGTLGLIRAAKAYDPQKDAEFRTYAYIRIRGAIIDELRGRSFVPVTVFHELRRIRQAYQKLAAELGRPPDDGELSREVNLPEEQLYRAFQDARKEQFLSIHGLDEERPTTGSLLLVDQLPSPDAQVERKETIARMTQAIKSLPERERILLLLYYERDLSMKEIAQVLDVTESRVSQLHAGALFKLSMKLR